MRQWLVNPRVMCRQHLLGEHNETHMFSGTMKKRISVDGYIENGLLDPSKLSSRHDELVQEMERRGYGHYSPLKEVDASYVTGAPCIDTESNLKELASRCEECRRLQNDHSHV